MDKAEVEDFKSLLRERKLALEAVEESSRASAKPVKLDQTSVGRLSRMDAMQAQQMAQEVVRRRAQQLVRIEGALRRIASSEYGVCFVCGEPIDARRLSVDPTFTRCMVCVNN